MKLIVANWKMNPNQLSDMYSLVKAFSRLKTKNKIVLCPPFVYIPLLKTKFELGAQDVFWQESGAYTGEISIPMLKQFKVKYVIIGHSERRALGETDEHINLKIKAALNFKLIPILCVGYGLTEQDSDEDIMHHLQNQLLAGLHDVDPTKVIVAYEPVWAIGSGKAATPEHAERVSMFIKIKFKVNKILYGGSTNSHNSSAFLKKEIDGLLVGGSSLQKDEFIKMVT